MPSITSSHISALQNSNISDLRPAPDSEGARLKDLLSAQHSLLNGEPLTEDQVKLLLEAAGDNEAARQFILQAANRPPAGSQPDAVEWAPAAATTSAPSALHEIDAVVASTSPPVEVES